MISFLRRRRQLRDNKRQVKEVTDAMRRCSFEGFMDYWKQRQDFINSLLAMPKSEGDNRKV